MITHCPICRYSLEGLPGNHQCPECGFEYDKDSLFFRSAGAIWAVMAVIQMAAAGLLTFGWWQKGNTFVGGMAVVFAASAAINFIRARQTARSGVLLSHDQVREIRRGIVVKSVHFDRIDRAEWSRVDGRTSLCRGDEEIEMIRTSANRALAQAIQARLTKRKQLVGSNVTLGESGKE